MMNQSLTFKNIGYGVISGLMGGVVFGIMLAKMGVLVSIGALIGKPDPIAGFVTHLIISSLMGVLFALVFCKLACSKVSGAIWGLIYGIFWWFLGPLTLMPTMAGKPVGAMWNLISMKQILPSLFGHIIFGIVLGFVYGWLQLKSKKR